MGFLWRFVPIIVSIGLLAGCDPDIFSFFGTKSDLPAARAAMERGEWIEAQYILERFLTREESADQRWEAWQLITAASQRLNPGGSFALEYLRAALAEFRDDHARSLVFERQIADEYMRMGRYREAEEVLARLARRALPHDEALYVNSRLAEVERRLGNVEAAEDAYLACLRLELSPQERAEKLLGLAEIRMIRKNMDMAGKAVREGLELSGVSGEIRSRLLFLWADLLEQKGDNEAALAVFAEALPTHANPAVVSYRIEMLQAKIRHANEPPRLMPWGSRYASPAGENGQSEMKKPAAGKTGRAAAPRKTAPTKPASAPSEKNSEQGAASPGK